MRLNRQLRNRPASWPGFEKQNLGGGASGGTCLLPRVGAHTKKSRQAGGRMACRPGRPFVNLLPSTAATTSSCPPAGNCQFRAISFGLYGAPAAGCPFRTGWCWWWCYCCCAESCVQLASRICKQDWAGCTLKRLPSLLHPQARHGTMHMCGGKQWTTCGRGGRCVFVVLFTIAS